MRVALVFLGRLSGIFFKVRPFILNLLLHRIHCRKRQEFNVPFCNLSGHAQGKNVRNMINHEMARSEMPVIKRGAEERSLLEWEEDLFAWGVPLLPGESNKY